jgi:hypothetical protein
MVNITKMSAKEILATLADKQGYKLVAKSAEEEGRVLVPIQKIEQYKTMSATQLNETMQQLLVSRDTINSRLGMLKRDLVNFMDKIGPNDYTKPVFDGGRLRQDKLFIRSDELISLENEITCVKDILAEAIKKDSLRAFLITNPEFKNILDDVIVEQGSMGYVANVRVKEVLPANIPVPPQEEKVRAGLTTTKTFK